MFSDSRPVRTLFVLAASLSIIAIAGCGTTGAFPSASSGGTGSGSSSAVLAVSPTSVSFGSVVVGSSSARSIAISNTGNAALTLSQVNLSGSGYSDSGLTLPLTLAAGTSTSFILTFTPPATGIANASISFISNASNSPMSMSLTGTGAAASVAQLTPNPSTVNFGSVTLGSSSTQSVSISNSGNVSVTISQITASGTGFSVTGVSVPLTLNPGQSSTYTAQFAPTTTGTASGQISFVSNATGSPNLVTLSGTAVAAPAPQLSVNATSLSFGSVNVGSSATKTVAISNSGNANLSISQIIVSGSGFTGSGITLPLTLTPGQGANYTVQFSPASAGSAAGQISFTSNAATTPTVSLTATGVTPPAPVLSVSPTNLSFGNLVVGNSSTKPLTITNSGGANLSISQITTSGAGFSGSGITLPLTLTPGQTATYTVAFAPASSGSASGQVSFTSNASTNPTVSLSGTGVTTTLTASPTSLSFGNVTVGSSATLSEKLTASNGAVTISAAIASGTGYSISGLTLPLTLSAGQSKTFSVVFAPAATGSSNGSLTITSDANTGPSAVSLSGTGVTTSSGPICGLLNDGLVHLPTNYDTFTPPGVGQSYVDPVYGCTVIRLTNGGAETFGDGTHPGLMNYYSTFTALNATDNLVLVIATDGNWSIRNTTGAIVVPSSNVPNWSGHPVWDASNGNVLYYPMGNSVYRGTISGSSVTQTLLHTFTEYSGVSSPDAADLSQDGDHMVLVGQNSNGTMDIFTWSFSQNSKTYVYTTSCTGGCLHKLQFSPDNRLTIQFNGDGTSIEQGVRLWTGSKLVHIEDNTNHYDTGYDLNGVPIIVARGNALTLSGETNPCPSGWGMDVRQLDNVNAAVCLLDNVGSWHVSYRGDASQPWIAISFFDTNTPGPEFFSSDSNYRTISTSNWQLYEDEIILAKVDGSKVYRLAHARSRSMESYWAQPHAAISRDGKYIVFSSDMAHPNGCPANMHVANDCSDVYMIRIQ